MNREILKFIEKQGSVFQASKYFGGMTELIKMAENNQELKSYLDYYTKGSLVFKADNRKEYFFGFHVKEFNVDEFESRHLFVIIDLIFKRNKSYQEDIGMWVDSYCEDTRPEYNFNDPELNKFQYVLARVDSVNGTKIPDGSRLEDMSTLISDYDAERMLKENVNECLKRLQTILK